MNIFKLIGSFVEIIRVHFEGLEMLRALHKRTCVVLLSVAIPLINQLPITLSYENVTLDQLLSHTPYLTPIYHLLLQFEKPFQVEGITN